MALSHAEIIGLSIKVLELFETEKDTFIKAGLDAEMIIKNLSNLISEVARLDAQQEYLEREKKITTDKLTKKIRRLYVTSSGNLDMAIGAVDKDSSFAKNIRQIRSGIKRRKNKEKSEQTE